jgi:hypothetical protein
MIPSELVHRFLTSMVFTVVVETSVLFFLLTYVFRRTHLKPSTILFAGFFASFATIGYVWFVFPAFFPRNVSLWWSEPFAFIVEAFFYRMYLKVSWREALILSLVANAASYFLGPLLRAYGFWIYW